MHALLTLSTAKRARIVAYESEVRLAVKAFTVGRSSRLSNRDLISNGNRSVNHNKDIYLPAVNAQGQKKRIARNDNDRTV